MDIFFCSDVLGGMRGNDESQHDLGSLLNRIESFPGLNYWTSAASINLLHCQKKDTLKEQLSYLLSTLSIIPLRKSMLQNAIAADPMEYMDRLEIQSIGSVKMDIVVTKDVQRFKDPDIMAVEPKNLYKALDEHFNQNTMSIPFLDLKSQLHLIYNDIDDKLNDIISNTSYILGKYVDEFERNFAQFQGVRSCIGVSSGTDALHIAFIALGLGAGDSAIVPVNTFIATAEAVSLTGATPVFIDCDSYDNIDTQALSAFLDKCKRSGNPLPKAIIPVHLYGQPADMAEIMKISHEYQIPIVEDCCQAHLAEWDGQKVGTFGKFGAFSFYPGKNLGAFGEAGALVTNDSSLFEKVRMIRQHGEIERYNHSVIGHNYRMAAIQGAVLATKLKHLEKWTIKRQKNATHYNEMLNCVDQVQTPAEKGGTTCVYHLYVIHTEDRDNLKTFLEQNGIATGLHYPIPLHQQKAYAQLEYKDGDFPMAEKAAKTMLSLPMYPELTKRQIQYVCDKIKEFYIKR